MSPPARDESHCGVNDDGLGSKNGGLRGGLPLDGRVGLRGFLAGFVLVRRIDGDFDCDLPSRNLLALNELDSLLLLLLVANIDESIALAPPGLAPSPSDNTGGYDLDTSGGEDFGESLVVDIESEVGDENDRLGRLAGGQFPFSTGSTLDLGCAGAFSGFSSGGLGGSSGGRSGFISSKSFAFGLLLVARLALKERKTS